ncbi:MAG: uncharacterized protein K0R15_139 [Clostridiales bacterium]|jgi:hypothetical protein|nr:uncharacterized protein [Clostridiales bacterium]
MKFSKPKPLSGDKNKRLNSKESTNCEYSAAWSDVDKIKSHSEVTVPSEENVANAKDWVDNGSKL